MEKCKILIKEDIQILIEHLESKGFVVDTLLKEHLLKINDQMEEEDYPVEEIKI